MNHHLESDPWQFVQNLNRVWTVERNPQALADYFHARIVAITPTDRLRRVGRAACIEGWKQFVEMAVIHAWTETDPQVELFGGGTCAVITYYYKADVEIGGARMTVAGRDMFTLAKDDGRWWAVADQVSGFPGERG